MVVHCNRCGKIEPLRKGRNRPSGGSLGSYEKMKGEIQNSFLKACPELCSSCLSDLFHFVNSPEHQRQCERRIQTRVAS